MKNANQFSLTIKDGVKGLITSILTVIVTMLFSIVNSGTFPATWTDWKPIVLAAISAGLAYILKNWLTNSDDQFLKKEINK
jgi:hypothetical protein